MGRQTPTKPPGDGDRDDDNADDAAVDKDDDAAACLRPINAPSPSMFMRSRRAANASPLEQPHASAANASQVDDSGSSDDDADDEDDEDDDE